MKPVAVIGAGITGLTAAFYLKRKGIPVTVYEAASRVGGVIQTFRQNGYVAESGPNTLLETSPKIRELIADAGLASRRLDTDPKAAARYIVRYRRPIAMPGSPLGFLGSDLFTWKARLALLREPFVPRRNDDVEETIAQFTVRRLNQEFLDHAIDALVAGIYAGDPDRLSVKHAFPRLKGLEDHYGSMIKGQIFGARERQRRGEVAKDRAPRFSFDEGLQVLPDTLAARLGDAVKLNTSVAKLTQATDGWIVELLEERIPRAPLPANETGDSRRSPLRKFVAEHSAVIFCGTAFRLAELKVELSAGPKSALTPALSHPTGEGEFSSVPEKSETAILSAFSEIRYPPVASVALGFRREDVRYPCKGFGMLIPKIEGFKILGTIFSSSLFPDRAPAGHLLLTSYVGGERYPEFALLPPQKLFELVQRDLRVLLGVSGQPTFQHCVFYPRAIPQYNVGYGRYQDLMNDLEAKAPGLFLAGHYRDGVSLSDSIMSGINATDRVAAGLKTTNEPE